MAEWFLTPAEKAALEKAKKETEERYPGQVMEELRERRGRVPAWKLLGKVGEEQLYLIVDAFLWGCKEFRGDLTTEKVALSEFIHSLNRKKIVPNELVDELVKYGREQLEKFAKRRGAER